MPEIPMGTSGIGRGGAAGTLQMLASGGAQTGGAVGTITINTAPAQAAVGQMRAVNAQLSQSMQQTAQSTGIAEKAVNLLAAAFTVRGVTAALRMTVSLAETAAQAERVEKSFDTLAGSVGQSAGTMLAKLQNASRGTISNTDLMLNANRAMLLGVSNDANQMAQLLEAARARGQAMGESAQQAFSDIVTGIGRLSPRILDNLGIVIDEQQAYRDYAAQLGVTAERLSDYGKKQALLNEVLKSSKDLLDGQSKSAEDNKSAFERATAAAENARIALGKVIEPDTVTATNGYADALMRVAGWLETIRRGQGGKSFGELQAEWATGGFMTPGLQAERSRRIAQGFGPLSDISRPALRAMPGGASQIKPIDTAAVAAVTLDWAQGVQKIERDAGQARLDATRQYEQQRTETIRSYELGLARDAQDFAIQRARQQQQFNEQVARSNADLDERIAQETAASGQRVAQIEDEYRRQRERAERDHRDNLMDAAAQLDAVAVYREQRNYAKQSKDAEEQHDKQVQAERDSLVTRIEEERKANAQRLDDARQTLAEQQRQEDEDRALRLQRQAEDHQHQLDQEAQNQAERLQQISRQAAEQRQALDDEHAKQMAALGLFNTAWSTSQQTAQAKALEEWDKYWNGKGGWLDTQQKAMQRAADLGLGLVAPGPAPKVPQRTYQSGGWVTETGMALVHSGEYVVPASRASTMMHDSRSYSLSPTIYIEGAGNPVAVGQEVERVLIRLLEHVAS